MWTITMDNFLLLRFRVRFIFCIPPFPIFPFTVLFRSALILFIRTLYRNSYKPTNSLAYTFRRIHLLTIKVEVQDTINTFSHPSTLFDHDALHDTLMLFLTLLASFILRTDLFQASSSIFIINLFIRRRTDSFFQLLQVSSSLAQALVVDIYISMYYVCQ